MGRRGVVAEQESALKLIRPPVILVRLMRKSPGFTKPTHHGLFAMYPDELMSTAFRKICKEADVPEDGAWLERVGE
jgi:hypothetical protein